MRISDWSADVCSSDLEAHPGVADAHCGKLREQLHEVAAQQGAATPRVGLAAGHPPTEKDAAAVRRRLVVVDHLPGVADDRSEERRVGKECVSSFTYRW